MKRKLFTLFAAVTALLLALTVLQGCGDKETPPPEPQETNDEETPKDPEKDGFYYRETEKGIVITGYAADDKVVTVPEKLNGKTVVEIADSAFEAAQFEKITVPKSVEKIGNAAFRFCGKLREADIEASVRSLGWSTFSFCRSLTKVSLPDSLETIGNNAFDQTGLKSIILPDSVKKLGTFVFFGCTELRSFTSGNGLTEIGNSCFSGCTALSELNLNEGLTTIGESCFSGCTSLKDIVIPSTVEVLQSYVFNGIGFEEYYVPTGVKKIEIYAFSNCRNLRNVYIPPNVEEIEEDAFDGCKDYVIRGELDSQAEIFADYNGLDFEEYNFED